MQKELEKKKMDEEKKRIRKDKIMLEKSSRDRKSNFDQKAHEEIEELQAKVSFFEISHFLFLYNILDCIGPIYWLFWTILRHFGLFRTYPTMKTSFLLDAPSFLADITNPYPPKKTL